MQSPEKIDISLYIMKCLYENTDINRHVGLKDISCYLRKEINLELSEERLDKIMERLMRANKEILRSENTSEVSYYIANKSYAINEIELLIDIKQPEWFLSYLNFRKKIKTLHNK